MLYFERRYASKPIELSLFKDNVIILDIARSFIRFCNNASFPYRIYPEIREHMQCTPVLVVLITLLRLHSVSAHSPDILLTELSSFTPALPPDKNCYVHTKQFPRKTIRIGRVFNHLRFAIIDKAYNTWGN